MIISKRRERTIIKFVMSTIWTIICQLPLPANHRKHKRNIFSSHNKRLSSYNYPKYQFPHLTEKWMPVTTRSSFIFILLNDRTSMLLENTPSCHKCEIFFKSFPFLLNLLQISSSHRMNERKSQTQKKKLTENTWRKTARNLFQRFGNTRPMMNELTMGQFATDHTSAQCRRSTFHS